MIEPVKFTYCPLRKALKNEGKQLKIREEEKHMLLQIKSKILAALINKENHNDNCR